MAETYCGKSCGECTQKEALNCPGCKAGPGRQSGGTCALAMCAILKGHETCDTCAMKESCGTLTGRDAMPDYHRRVMEAEGQQKSASAYRASVLGKWIWILFWLLICLTVVGRRIVDIFMVFLPLLAVPAELLNIACVAAYGVILMKLDSFSDRYHRAGICTLAALCVICAIPLIRIVFEGSSWVLLLVTLAAVVACVGAYQECMGHASVLAEVDPRLSKKWRTLGKWRVGLILGICVGQFIIVFQWGALIYLAAILGTTVAIILNLIYLYRTAKIFREGTNEKKENCVWKHENC